MDRILLDFRASRGRASWRARSRPTARRRRGERELVGGRFSLWFRPLAAFENLVTFARIATFLPRRQLMIANKSTILAQSARASARRSGPSPTTGQWLAVALFAISWAAAFGLVANTAPELAPIETIRVDIPQPVVRRTSTSR